MQHEQGNPECICDGCLDEQVRELDRQREGQIVADTVCNYLNHSNAKYVVMGLARQHRTLQQLVTRLCKEWFEHLASLSEDQVDGRNWASREMAKKVVATKEWQESYLPHV